MSRPAGQRLRPPRDPATHHPPQVKKKRAAQARETARERSYDSLAGWLDQTGAGVLPEGLMAFARRFISPDIERKAEIMVRRYHGGRHDPFGFDFSFAVYVLVVAGLVYRYWFRVKMEGIENVPAGRCLLVANHSGQIPIDGAMIAAGLILDAPEPRLVRSLYEKWGATLPFVSTFFARCGQVVGRPENLDRLMRRDETVLVFPEGAKGISKPYTKAYTLTEFGLGFMRLALEHGCPVVPVAVIGAEEQYPSVANIEKLARALHMPAVPIPVQAFVPVLGLLPLPAKYRIMIGAPMRFEGNPDDEDSAIAEKVWTVRHAIQVMLGKGLRERRHVFW